MKIQLNKEQVKEWLLENLFAIVFSCIALGLFVWTQNSRSEVGAINQKKTQKELEQKRMRSDLQALHGIDKELKEIDDQFLKLGEQLLNFAKKTEVYRLFLSFENSTKLKFGTPSVISAFNLTKKTEIDLEKNLKDENGHIVAVEYQISTEGDYASLLKFFQLLKKSKNFISIKSLELKEGLESLQQNAFGLYMPMGMAGENTSEEVESLSKKLSVIVRLIVLGEIKINETQGV